MKTVNEVSKITGISVRTLHYYDTIGLLSPAQVTQSGYRMYDEPELERLSQILLFRELEFSLKEISHILDSPNYNKMTALEQQIQLLTLQRERLDGLIAFATGLREKGELKMSFEAFDKSKQEEYAKQAKERWGDTAAYHEYEEKSKGQNEGVRKSINDGLMDIFVEFGTVREESPESKKAQACVLQLKEYITEHFYTCTMDILRGLGQMYAAGGEMTENIDKAGGKGTAVFAASAIAACKLTD